ncbi:unnamed protein product, partial [Didymodactylos carnosus]
SHHRRNPQTTVNYASTKHRPISTTSSQLDEPPVVIRL